MPFREIVSEDPVVIGSYPEPTLKKPIPPQVQKSVFPRIIDPTPPKNASVISGNPRTTILDIPFIQPQPTPTPTPAAPAPAPIPQPIPEPIPEPVYQPPVVQQPQPPVVQQPQMIQISADDYARLLQQHQQPVPAYVEPQEKKRRLPTITLPKIDTSNSKKIGIAMVKLAVSVILIWFGLTSTGSYFGPASGKFGGQLAQIFYQYQIGSLVCMIGVVIAYDALT